MSTGAAHAPVKDALSRPITAGNLLLELDRTREAIPPLEKAVELRVNNANCHLKLGTGYLRTNRLPEAQRELEKAERLEPENAAIHYQLARFYKQTQQMDKAKIEFQRTEEPRSRAARTRPSNPSRTATRRTDGQSSG